MAIGSPRFGSPFERRLERSGKVNERFAFGQVRVESDEYSRAMQALIQRHREAKTAVTLGEAIELIKRYQPFELDRRVPQDPINPVKQFPNNLRQRVAEKLGLERRGRELVRFWTAVGSIVDTEFKADAVIELAGRSEKDPSRYVRIDASLYTGPTYESAEDTRDRVIISQIPDVHEDPDSYREFVDATADEIAEKFRSQKNVPSG